MIHCQACGAKNADDARFCNMCGAKIAGAGETGGPKPDAPQAASGGATGSSSLGGAGGTTTTHSSAYGGDSSTLGNQTLAGIGIQSGRRAYGMLAGAALGFLAVGAGLMWLMMHGGDAPIAEGAEPPPYVDPETGEVLPDGLEPPDDDSYLAGTRVVRPGAGGTSGGAAPSSSGGSVVAPSASSGGSGSAGSTPSGSGGSVAPSSGGSSSGSSGGTRPSSSGGSSSGSSGSSGATTGSSGGSSSGSSGAATGSSGGSSSSGTTASSGGGSSSSGGASGGPPPDWESMDETIGDEPPDRELDLYLGNVRRFIRTHYARQAQACFDHATALSGSGISGRVVIGFTIAANGDTEDVHVARNDTGIDTLGMCVANRVNSWRLPSPPGGEPMALEMPFNP